MGKRVKPRIKRWSREYYILNLKAMPTWKKVALVMFVLIALFGSKFGISLWKKDDPLDWSEKPPIYGIQKKIDF